MFKKTDILFYKEAALLSFVIAFSFTLILLIVKMTLFTKLIFASDNIVLTMLSLFCFLSPSILAHILPISLFTGSTLIATRMVADKEMDALFSFGMSMRQMLAAPIFFGLLSVVLILFNSFYCIPYSKEQMKLFKWLQARQMFESFVVNNLQEKSFISDFPQVGDTKLMFYVNSMSRSESFQDVFMTFETDNQIKHFLVAKQGKLIKTLTDNYPDFIFSLERASIYSGNTQLTQFKKVNFSILNAFKDKLNTTEEFQNTPTQRSTQDTLKAISIALCAFFFPILGMCMGLLNTNMKPFRIYAAIGLIILMFFSLISISAVVIDKFGISPFFVYPIPPIIFGILTVLLARERHKIK